MKTEIIQYEPEHAMDIVTNSSRGKDEWLSKFPEWESWTRGWKTEGPAYTVMIDGQIVACGGITLLGWNRGEAWALFSCLLGKYKKTCFKLSKEIIDRMITDNKLIRVQAMASPIYQETQRFLIHLGFVYEGVLRSYGPNNEDQIVYSRVT